MNKIVLVVYTVCILCSTMVSYSNAKIVSSGGAALAMHHLDVSSEELAKTNHHSRNSHNHIHNHHQRHNVHHYDVVTANEADEYNKQPNITRILDQKVDRANSINSENDSFKFSDRTFDEPRAHDKKTHHHNNHPNNNHHHRHHNHHNHQRIEYNTEKVKETVPCPKCQSHPEQTMTEEELTRLRIEYVKTQILQKLQMTEPPKVSARNLPRPIARGSLIFSSVEEEQQNVAREQFYGKTTQKIIFLQLDNEKCKGVENFGSYMCFTFDIPDDIDYHDVDAAELWVYREPVPNANAAQSFLVSEIESWDSKKINKPLAIHYANSSEGWGAIDFTWSVRNWMKYRNLHHVIDISCNTCEKNPASDLFSLNDGYRPFIIVNTTSSQTIKRQRRNIQCTPGVSECCRDRLYISFAEIGWNDWILAPSGYDAYFCRGTCSTAATISSDSANYNLFLRRLMHSQTNGANNTEKKLELVPCCTATQFSSLDLLYVESNTTATRKTLPNMVVEACGCL